MAREPMGPATETVPLGGLVLRLTAELGGDGRRGFLERLNLVPELPVGSAGDQGSTLPDSHGSVRHGGLRRRHFARLTD